MTDFKAARIAMVDCQVRPSDVTRYPIIDAMLTVAREEFVPSNMRNVAYAGDHIPLAPGRVVLDPRVMGKMLDLAEIKPTDLVLHIGAGLGYGTALMGRMGEAVVAVEEIEEMSSEAARILSEQDALNVVVETGPLAAGAPAHGPYDVIMIEGAIETLPDVLVAQLKDGGKLVTLVREDGVSQCRMGTKSGSGLSWRRAFDATAPVLPGFEAEKAFEF